MSIGPKGTATRASYSSVDNARRKETRVSESYDSVGPNKEARAYTSAAMGTAQRQAADQAKKDAAANKKQPVKRLSPDEIKAVAHTITPPKSKNLIKFMPNGQWKMEDK